MLKPIWFVEPALSVLAQSFGGGAVEGTRTRSSDQQYDALLSGAADVAITAMDNVFAWNRRGDADDFRIVAQVEETTPLTLMCAPGFDGSGDLRGARILVDAPANGFVVALRAFLADRGTPIEADALMPAGGVTERCEALLGGGGDVTLLGPPLDGVAAAAGASVLGRLQDRYPNFPGQGLVVRLSSLDRIGSALSAWLADLDEARHRYAADPSRAADILIAAGVPVRAAAGFAATLPASLTPNPSGISLLIAHRHRLGLPGGSDTPECLLAPFLIGASYATN